jgi:hypothetical protein
MVGMFFMYIHLIRFFVFINVPGYEKMPLDQDLDKDIVPRGAFVIAAYRLKRAIEENIFPENFNQHA